MNKRFWSKVRREGSCRVWTGTIAHDGYGKYSGTSAHAYAYREAYGDLEPGYELDHLCRNRSCVNPLHLQPVTRRENIMRSDNFAAVNARKTHCVNGHEFTPENTYLYRGWRNCKECNRELVRAYKLRKRASQDALESSQ